MIVDNPQGMEEVTAASDAYEAALLVNDLATLDALFWDDPRVERVSPVGEQIGMAAIRSFRAARPATGLARERLARRIVCFDEHSAVVNIVFRRIADNHIGRQSQVWVKTGTVWRIVFAHISDRAD